MSDLVELQPPAVPLPAALRPELLAPPAIGTASARRSRTGPTRSTSASIRGFNARARAANFAADELPRLMDLLHRRGVRGYVTLNTLVFPSELPEVEQLMRRIAAGGRRRRAGAGPGRRAADPRDLPRPADPRLDADDADQRRGLEFVREQLGVERVVLARELSVDEIAQARTDSLDAAGGVRARGAVRRLFGPVPDQRIAGRTQRQPRPVCPGLPPALRAGCATARTSTWAT